MKKILALSAVCFGVLAGCAGMKSGEMMKKEEMTKKEEIMKKEEMMKK